MLLYWNPVNDWGRLGVKVVSRHLTLFYSYEHFVRKWKRRCMIPKLFYNELRPRGVSYSEYFSLFYSES